MAKAVFLDRDETLNPDPGYISDPSHFHLYPWVSGELRRLKEAGFLLVIVSNQSGVGRGLIRQESLLAIHQKLNLLLLDEAGIQVDHFAVCIHRPEDGCECRKPKPNLIIDSAQRLGIDLSASYMIGDRDSDRDAGISAGVRKSFKIGPGDEESFRRTIREILENEMS
ncbi:HAD family hydrolase [bacterium]|jgi:histidinol-phosphate phosphatase family protein|nr:HAD family hydrolase [bacterium]